MRLILVFLHFLIGHFLMTLVLLRFVTLLSGMLSVPLLMMLVNLGMHAQFFHVGVNRIVQLRDHLIPFGMPPGLTDGGQYENSFHFC